MITNSCEYIILSSTFWDPNKSFSSAGSDPMESEWINGDGNEYMGKNLEGGFLELKQEAKSDILFK